VPKHRVCAECGKENPLFARNYCVNCGRPLAQQKGNSTRWLATIGIVACIIIGSISAIHFVSQHMPGVSPNTIPNQLTTTAAATIPSKTQTIRTTSTTSVSTTATYLGSMANTGNFSLQPQAVAVTVYKTKTVTLEIQIQSINNFKGQIELSASGSPNGLGIGYSSNPVSAGTVVVLSFSAKENARNGTYRIAIVATYSPSESSPVVSGTVIYVTVADFQVSVTPPSDVVNAGSTASFTITLTLQKGFTDPVSVTSVSGLPHGATYSMTVSNATVLAGHPGTAEIIVRIKTVTMTQTDTYPITIVISGGGVTHSVTTQIVVK